MQAQSVHDRGIVFGRMVLSVRQSMIHGGQWGMFLLCGPLGHQRWWENCKWETNSHYVRGREKKQSSVSRVFRNLSIKAKQICVLQDAGHFRTHLVSRNNLHNDKQWKERGTNQERKNEFKKWALLPTSCNTFAIVQVYISVICQHNWLFCVNMPPPST